MDRIGTSQPMWEQQSIAVWHKSNHRVVMAGHNLSSFINNVLLDEMQRMLTANTLYLLTGQVACGIEFLGACVDNHDFHESGHSEKRFRLGLGGYMAKVDSRYATFNARGHSYDLYYHLRCGMAHVVRPAGNVVFVDRGNGLIAALEHLTVPVKLSKLVIFPEQFTEDFAKACALLVADLPRFAHPKLTNDFLPVSEIG